MNRIWVELCNPEFGYSCPECGTYGHVSSENVGPKYIPYIPLSQLEICVMALEEIVKMESMKINNSVSETMIIKAKRALSKVKEMVGE